MRVARKVMHLHCWAIQLYQHFPPRSRATLSYKQTYSKHSLSLIALDTNFILQGTVRTQHNLSAGSLGCITELEIAYLDCVRFPSLHDLLLLSRFLLKDKELYFTRNNT